MIYFINKKRHSVLQVQNGAQFLNATRVSFPTFTVISPVTKEMYQNNHKDLI